MTQNTDVIDGTVTQDIADPKPTSRIARMKNFVTSPTFIITAPVYVAAGVALVLAARKTIETEDEDI
jgi:hypothetical protein